MRLYIMKYPNQMLIHKQRQRIDWSVITLMRVVTDSPLRTGGIILTKRYAIQPLQAIPYKNNPLVHRTAS